MQQPDNVVPMASTESLKALMGFEEIGVVKRDGTPIAVKVRELNFAQIPTYAGMLDDREDKLAALFLGEGDDFVAQLTRDSVVKVVQKGEELNFPFTVAWLTRQSERQAKLAAALGLKTEELQRKAKEFQSGASSPTSAQ